MFLPEIPKAAAEIARVIENRRLGRSGCLVCAGQKHLSHDSDHRHQAILALPPQIRLAPGIFRLAKPGDLAGMLQQAGFTNRPKKNYRRCAISIRRGVLRQPQDYRRADPESVCQIIRPTKAARVAASSLPSTSTEERMASHSPSPSKCRGTQATVRPHGAEKDGQRFRAGSTQRATRIDAPRDVGGYGLYCGSVFFGIVQKGRLYSRRMRHSATISQARDEAIQTQRKQPSRPITKSRWTSWKMRGS